VLRLGVVGGYRWLFGRRKAAGFFGCFSRLSFLVHRLYRIRSERYTRNRLDFVVEQEEGRPVAKSNGKFYHSAPALTRRYRWSAARCCGRSGGGGHNLLQFCQVTADTTG